MIKDIDKTKEQLIAELDDLREQSKKREEEHKESQKKYRLLIENSPDLIAIHNMTEILHINNSGLKLVGATSLDEVVGKSAIDFIHPDDRAIGLENIKKLFSREESKVAMEQRFIRLDGKVIHVEVIGVPINYGEEPMIQIIARDITERKQADKKLLESENNLRTLFNAMTDIVFEMDYDGRYINIAPTSPELMFKPSDDTIGKTLHEVFPKSEADIFLEFIRECLDENKTNIIEYPMVIDDKTIWFEGRATPKTKNSVLYIARDITERKQAEKALRESEQKYRSVVGQSFDGITLSSDKGIVIEWNRAQERITGLSREDVLGQPLWDVQIQLAHADLKTPEMHTQLKAGLLGAIKGEDTSWDGRLHDQDIHCSDSTSKTVQSVSFRVKTDGETMFGTIIRDITERKLAEEVLKESESKFKGLFTSVSSGIVFCEAIYDNNMNMIDCIYKDMNSLYGNFTDLKKETAIGKRVSEMLPGTEPEWFTTFGQVVKTGNPIEFEMYHKQSGKYYSVFAYNSNIDEFAAIFEDITERKQTEIKLKESEERYRSLVTSLPVGIFRSTLEGKILSANPAMIEIYGFDSFEELTNVPAAAFYSDDNPRVKMLADLKKEGYLLEYETLEKKKDGSLIWVSTNYKLAYSDFDDTNYINGVVFDITERKQAEQTLKVSEQKLREGNAEKDKFFSIIAHDLKSPFNGIMGFSQLLVEQVRENDYDNIEKYAEIILNSSHRAVDLLTNLMEWSRSQTGRMEFSPEYLRVADLCNETVDLLQTIAGQKSITLKNEIPPKAIVFADNAMISTVIRNLISNAVKFTKSGGKIMVSAHEKQNELIISVSDSGVGIPKDRIEKLFILSESYSTAGTNKEKGTGLGLILCKEFIEKNGGRIWVESDPDRKSGAGGSIFYFTIPTKPL
ncbi:PAS domain S-box protein [Lentimicrobium sp. S6]|uniref:PAS domain S-box protein n=1 Tax=Lentimicrobium sp. S6 TaxID=2735872 RepID=UPI0015557C2A|nr:PAS domain S-box protein [Lentimicrobium sp. S6]NPD48120.1 PAS domain S-box protein [Lentimicrobium sp. S6]